jgi:hypothetical protein
VNASGGRFIVSDCVRGHPNKFAMTSDDCLFCFACGAPGAIDLGLGGVPPKSLGLGRAMGPGEFLCETPQAYTLARLLEQGHLVGYDLRCGKGADGNAEKCARFSHRLVTASSIAWARHYRVTAEPCPDRCKSTRLSLCSACMGGVMTCAQQHVCSNNRAVVCGEESTVSLTCWGPRIRW